MNALRRLRVIIANFFMEDGIELPEGREFTWANHRWKISFYECHVCHTGQSMDYQVGMDNGLPICWPGVYYKCSRCGFHTWHLATQLEAPTEIDR